MDAAAEIRAYIVDHFLFGDADRLTDDTSFLASRVVDSTGIMELISFIEGRYNIAVEDQEMVPQNLDSVNNLVAYITRKTGKAAA